MTSKCGQKHSHNSRHLSSLVERIIKKRFTQKYKYTSPTEETHKKKGIWERGDLGRESSKKYEMHTWVPLSVHLG